MERLVANEPSRQKSGKALVVIVAAVLVLGVAGYNFSSTESPLIDLYRLEQAEFHSFMNTHNRDYTDQEYSERFKIFRENTAFIRKMNSLNKGFTLVVNKFADLSSEEFKAKYLGAKLHDNLLASNQKVHQMFEATKDWRNEGKVTGVKDQGYCGSCWAFSATGAIESAYHIKYNKPVLLSEQQLVDCSKAYGNMGCDGGLMHLAFDYVMAKGIVSGSQYPYKAHDQRCHWLKTWGPVTKLQGYGVVQENDFNALASAIHSQPVSVAVDASTWSFYGSGVWPEDMCSTDLNHGVLAVGYDMNEGFFTIKNSWGTGWGEDGYIRLSITPGAGTCGVQLYGVYPIL
jgi:C1A family cysteine protease